MREHGGSQPPKSFACVQHSAVAIATKEPYEKKVNVQNNQRNGTRVDFTGKKTYFGCFLEQTAEFG